MSASLLWEVIERTRCAICLVQCNPVFICGFATCGNPECMRNVEDAMGVIPEQPPTGASADNAIQSDG